MRISNSELYRMKTSKSCLYNIMPISNIPSVIENGLLCYNKVITLNHYSIALNGVQERREKVKIPGGMWLHQYANLYFTHHNPMLFLRKDNADSLCVLAFDSSILDIDGCIVSDRNAATELVRFYSPEDGIERINFDKVFAEFWTHPENIYEYQNHKAIKCAEVLVPEKVEYEYIVGAYVSSEESKNRMIEMNFNKPIIVKPSVFFIQ